MDDVSDEQQYLTAEWTSVANLLERRMGYCDFAVSGARDLHECGLQLHVRDGLAVALPLSVEQAQELSGVAVPAPFGRGAATVFDPSVRKTLQLAPEQFAVSDAQPSEQSWSKALRGIVNQVKVELGLSRKSSVRADLYKLLLYEPGDFFAPHRDSEKGAGMFASLVIVLPSPHTGGEVIVHHRDEKRTFACSDNDAISYFAFYSDCTHEVKPVTSGYRLCLIYNLCFTNTKVEQMERQRLLQRDESVCVLGHALRAAVSQESGSDWFMVLALDHKYSEAGMGFYSLKGEDRARVNLLEAAIEAEGLPLELMLGSLKLMQSRPLERKAATYSPDSLDLINVRDRLGRRHPIGSIRVWRKSLMPQTAFTRGRKWDHVGEHNTGNEGMQMERWYLTGAVVIRPRGDLWSFLEKGAEYGAHLYYILHRFCVGEPNSVSAYTDEEIYQLAKRLSKVDPDCPILLLESLMALGAVDMICDHLRSTCAVYTRDLIDYVDTVCLAVEKFGYQALQAAIKVCLEAANRELRVCLLRRLAQMGATRFSWTTSERAMLATEIAGLKPEDDRMRSDGLAIMYAAAMDVRQEAKARKILAYGLDEVFDKGYWSQTKVGKPAVIGSPGFPCYPVVAGFLTTLQRLMGNDFLVSPGIPELLQTVVPFIRQQVDAGQLEMKTWAMRQTTIYECSTGCPSCGLMAAFLADPVAVACEIPPPPDWPLHAADRHFNLRDYYSTFYTPWEHHETRALNTAFDCYTEEPSWVELRPNSTGAALIATKKSGVQNEWRLLSEALTRFTRPCVWTPEEHHNLRSMHRRGLLAVLILLHAQFPLTLRARFRRLPLELVLEVFQWTT